MLSMNDPRGVFYTSSRIEGARSLISRYKSGSLPPGVTNTQLWDARKVYEATIHPDTKQVLPPYFRMSFFLFANIPICVGMLLTAPTMTNQFLAQWANQSYNAAFNYGNRNATKETNNTQILTSYLSATSVAVTTALGLSVVVKRATNLKPAVRLLIQRTVPFVAVASAGAFNAVAMRYREAIDGIEVLDKPVGGKVVGTSVTAGRAALLQIAASRIALPLPILLIPPYAIPFILSFKFCQSRPWMKIPVELAVIAALIAVGFPGAVALFPQTASLPVTSIEPKFHNLVGDDGKPLTTVYFNKGL